MKTQQKRVKFTKGEINQLSNERTDLSILDDSASFIKNYIPTIFGGFKTRMGTKKIDVIKTIDTTGVNRPTITSWFGGNTNYLFDNNHTFETENLISNNTGAIFDIDFSSSTGTINFLRLNGITLKKPRSGIFTCDILKTQPMWNFPDYYEYYFTQVNVVDPGFGYDTRITQPFIFGGQWDKKPIVNASFLFDGSVAGGSNQNTGARTSNPGSVSVTLPNNAVWKTKLTLQGKDENNDYIDLAEFEVSSDTILNVDLNIPSDATYSEFKLVKKENDLIISKLQLNSISYGILGAPTTNAKLFDFVFDNDNQYIICIQNQYILIYKNDTMIASLSASVLTYDLFDKLKATQTENMMVFTHPNIHPQVLTRTSSGWSFGEFSLSHIPVFAFDGETTTTNTTITLTPSATDGTGYLTASASFFTTNSVGQIIDGGGGRFRITEYSSGTKVFGYTIIPFYTTDAFTNFKYISGYEPIWSNTRGWPNSCLFYQERLWFGGSLQKPLNICGSRLGQYHDFNNVGNYDNDSINVDLSCKQNNEIVNLYGNRGLQIFSGGAEFVANENNLTPNNIFITQTSSVGSKGTVEPKDIAGVTLFVDRKGLNCNTFLYNYEQATFNASALTLLNNQVIKNPTRMVIDFNSNFEDGNFVYLVNSDGTVAVGNVLLEQNINAFTRFETKNGEVKDMVVLGDSTYFLIKRDNILFLEKLENLKTDFTSIVSVNNTDTISGLDIYNNKDVRVYSNKKDYGVYFVIDGEITLKETITDTVYIGYDIECKLVSNNLSVANQTTNIKTRLSKATITTNNTKSLIFNKRKIRSDKDIYNLYACSDWKNENKFTIESVFDYLEIKSIVLNINYGR